MAVLLPRFTLVVGGLFLLACTKAPTAQEAREALTRDAESSPAPAEAPALDPAAAALVREAFDQYRAWGRVDDELRWAPFKCLTPLPARPARSEAAAGGHAKKLYSLFAKDRASYAALERGGIDAGAGGQTIVKESFVAEIVDRAGPVPAPSARLQALQERPITADHFDGYLREGDTLYRAGSLAAVFVIVSARGDAKAASDDGWIYGTLSPAGQVTSAGRVASCMECHSRAPHDRLFGPKPDHRAFGLAH